MKPHVAALIAATAVILVSVIIYFAITAAATAAKTPSPAVVLCTADTDCKNGGVCPHPGQAGCLCPEAFSGPLCDAPANSSASSSVEQRCMSSRMPCLTSNDCTMKCGDPVMDWDCANSVCVPATPSTFSCDTAAPGQESVHKPIKVWTGWGDSNTMGWECDCEYPNFFALSSDGKTCQLRPEVCQFGAWTYPCRRDPANVTRCLPSGDVPRNAPPQLYGMCRCSDAPCSSDSDCASKRCVGGKCVGQRLGVHPELGVPTCVPDTCSKDSPFVLDNSPPYLFGSCSVKAAGCSTGCEDLGPESGCVCSQSCPFWLDIHGVYVDSPQDAIVGSNVQSMLAQLRRKVQDNSDNALASARSSGGSVSSNTLLFSQIGVDIGNAVNQPSRLFIQDDTAFSSLCMPRSVQTLPDSTLTNAKPALSISLSNGTHPATTTLISLLVSLSRHFVAFSITPNDMLHFFDTKHSLLVQPKPGSVSYML